MAWVGGVMKSVGFGKSEVESANNQVFVTSGYIVNGNSTGLTLEAAQKKLLEEVSYCSSKLKKVI